MGFMERSINEDLHEAGCCYAKIVKPESSKNPLDDIERLKRPKMRAHCAYEVL